MTDARHGNVCTTVNRPNLILGAVAKYDLPPLLPFLNSLARTGFRGETHLFSHCGEHFLSASLICKKFLHFS